MIAEALALLFKMGAEAAGAANKQHALVFPDDPNERFLVGADGKFMSLGRRIPDRNHKVGRLSDIAEFAKRHSVAVQEANTANDSQTQKFLGSVWIESDYGDGRLRVHLVCNDQDDSPRADRVVCEFVSTDSFAELEQATAMQQPDFARWLRVKMAKSGVPQKLVDWVAKITWNNRNSATGTSVNGRESLGLDIESSAMSDAGPAPDLIKLSVQVFPDPILNMRHDVDCAFVPDPKNRTLQLVPLAGELEVAWDQCCDAAEFELQRLLPQGFPVYRGRP